MALAERRWAHIVHKRWLHVNIAYQTGFFIKTVSARKCMENCLKSKWVKSITRYWLVKYKFRTLYADVLRKEKPPKKPFELRGGHVYLFTC